jgi:peroxiredoxin
MAVSSTMLPLGTAAPDFTLPDTNRGPDTTSGPDTTGRMVALADAEGAPATLVVFLCNHCPYVQHLADSLADVTAGLIERGVAVFGISSNDPIAYPDDAPERMAEEAERRGYRFPYLFDASQDVARAYHAACTPDFFLFDRDRRLAYRGQYDSSRPGNGEPVTGADLLRAVDAVLAGQPIDADQRPSIGCSIKWRD